MSSLDIICRAEEKLHPLFKQMEDIAYHNQEKVLNSFQQQKVRDTHFSASSGYGYSDIGRDVLEKIYASVLGTEDAMVRSQIVSGTHAISACLFGLLRPGDELVSVVGSPYDTLCNVIGHNNKGKGTLCERGIKYKEVSLTPEGKPDLSSIRENITSQTRMVLMQRSRGYSRRPALTIEDIRSIICTVRSDNPQTILFADNCYGEFTEAYEPTNVGVDLMAGSLIKNPGGGMAPAGGYIAGKNELVEEVAYHITAPGLGKALGASLLNNRLLYQGLFIAPHVVLQALKGAALLAYIFEKFGYLCFPRWDEPRGDIVQAIALKDSSEVLRFCQIVQSSSPVDSDVKLEFASLPGYADGVVMAAGTFVQGSSIELSCDAPWREPYTAFFQGGLTYEHCRLLVKKLIEGLLID